MKPGTSGSCLCGEVRFEIEGAFESFFLCHCEYCRKDSGSAHASNLFSTSARLRWISGKDLVKSYTVPGTRHAKSFCAHCGAPLPNMQMEGELLVVPAGSLDEPLSIQPNAHIFVANRANWDQNLEDVPELEQGPG